MFFNLSCKYLFDIINKYFSVKRINFISPDLYRIINSISRKSEIFNCFIRPVGIIIFDIHDKNILSICRMRKNIKYLRKILTNFFPIYRIFPVIVSHISSSPQISSFTSITDKRLFIQHISKTYKKGTHPENTSK